MKDHKYDDWAVKSAMETLMRAEEIKQDPKMMKLVSAHLKKQKKAIRSIEDIKQASRDLEDA